MVKWILLILCGLGPPTFASESGLPDLPRAARLIARLAAEDFHDREAASEELFRCGPGILPLLQFLHPTNAEIASRLDNLRRRWRLRAVVEVVRRSRQVFARRFALSARKSFSDDFPVFAFEWSQCDGPPCELEPECSRSPWFMNVVPSRMGTYRFRLRIFDGTHWSPPQEISISAVKIEWRADAAELGEESVLSKGPPVSFRPLGSDDDLLANP